LNVHEDTGGKWFWIIVAHLANKGGSNLGRRDGVTHSDIAIGAHDREEDGAGELVDARCCHVGLAHDVTKRPGLPAHRREQEGDADKEAFICHGQVYDVHIGDGLHLGEANHHIDDEGIA